MCLCHNAFQALTLLHLYGLYTRCIACDVFIFIYLLRIPNLWPYVFTKSHKRVLVQDWIRHKFHPCAFWKPTITNHGGMDKFEEILIIKFEIGKPRSSPPDSAQTNYSLQIGEAGTYFQPLMTHRNPWFYTFPDWIGKIACASKCISFSTILWFR